MNFEVSFIKLSLYITLANRRNSGMIWMILLHRSLYLIKKSIDTLVIFAHFISEVIKQTINLSYVLFSGN